MVGIILSVTLTGLVFSPNYRSRLFGIGLPRHDFMFSIDYPKNWVIFELPDGNHGDKEAFATITSVSFGRFYPNMVIARKLTDSQSLSDVLLWGENRKSKIIPGNTYEYDTSNYKGLMFEYEQQSTDLFSNGSLVDCKDWYILTGLNGYSLAFCAYKDQWNEVEQVYTSMLQSFKVGN